MKLTIAGVNNIDVGVESSAHAHMTAQAIKIVQGVCSAQICKSIHTSCFDLIFHGSAAKSHSIYEETAVHAHVADSA